MKTFNWKLYAQFMSIVALNAIGGILIEIKNDFYLIPFLVAGVLIGVYCTYKDKE